MGKNIDELEDQIKVLDEAVNFLIEWLYQHIIGSDALIGKLDPVEEWMVKENPCEFSDEYKTDIPLIDAEHETLFDITRKVYDILKEGATEEEIQAWQEENKTKENIQVTEEHQLLSTVLLENAEIKEKLKEQQELSATLALQIAQLKGGNANV